MVNLKNLFLINNLQSSVSQDIILFGLDGMSYYGSLQSIDENGIALLGPASLSSTGLVEIQNPAEVSAVENQVSFNLCYLVGYGYNITADPFVIPNDDAEDVTTDAASLDAKEGLECCGCSPDALIEKLKSMDQGVTIATLGGFLFAGLLESIDDNIAKLKMEYIFAPGGDGSTLFSINDIVVNMDAATAVAS